MTVTRSLLSPSTAPPAWKRRSSDIRVIISVYRIEIISDDNPCNAESERLRILQFTWAHHRGTASSGRPVRCAVFPRCRSPGSRAVDLVLIGLGIAFDPIPLTTFLVVLPSNLGAAKGAAFVFGWLVSLAIVVTVTVLATGNSPPRPHTSPASTALAVRIAIGVVLARVSDDHGFLMPARLPAR